MRVPRALCAGGLGFATSCLVACGGSGSLLSAQQSSQLNAQLVRASQALSAHQCREASDQISAFRSSVDGLSSVDQTLISNLDQGASTIATLAERECPASTATNTTPTTPTHTETTTIATQTVTTPRTTTATTPTTATTTTTPSTPTQTTPAPQSGGVSPGGPGNGNGHGNGHGNGNGNGNGNAPDTSP